MLLKITEAQLKEILKENKMVVVDKIAKREPVQTEYGTFSMSKEVKDRLSLLSEKWEMSKSAVVRHLIEHAEQPNDVEHSA